MKKAIATPYLVAIILGIIVIGVITYMFIRQAGLFGVTAEEQQCRTKALQYCTDKPTEAFESWALRNNAQACPKYFSGLTSESLQCQTILATGGSTPAAGGTPTITSSTCPSSLKAVVDLAGGCDKIDCSKYPETCQKCC